MYRSFNLNYKIGELKLVKRKYKKVLKNILIIYKTNSKLLKLKKTNLKGLKSYDGDFNSSGGLLTHLKCRLQSNPPYQLDEVFIYLKDSGLITSITGLTIVLLSYKHINLGDRS